MGGFDAITEAIKGLSSSLGASIGAGMKEALDETLGDAARQRRAQEKARAKERLKILEMLNGACGLVYKKSRADAQRALQDDERMPRRVNYQERYLALRSMDDRKQVLKRIAQTIDLAKEIMHADAPDQAGEACREAADSMRASLEKCLDTASGEILGTRLSGEGFERYHGTVTCERRVDPAVLEQLAAEVDRSFVTFKNVVMDNGLFTAFASEGSYGACSGWRGWWDWDDDYGEDSHAGDFWGSRGEVRGIPEVFEEDKGGDTPERAVERMREENRRPYDGIFDDDVTPHVDAFWYGFRKLMEFVNGMYYVDLRPLSAYWRCLEGQIDKGCDSLADKVTYEQAQSFAVRALADKMKAGPEK